MSTAQRPCRCTPIAITDQRLFFVLIYFSVLNNYSSFHPLKRPGAPVM